MAERNETLLLASTPEEKLTACESINSLTTKVDGTSRPSNISTNNRTPCCLGGMRHGRFQRTSDFKAMHAAWMVGMAGGSVSGPPLRKAHPVPLEWPTGKRTA